MNPSGKTIVLFACLFAAGCSSERVVNFDVSLKTDDDSITIKDVHFTSANRVGGISPENDSDRSVTYKLILYSSVGNFVIVDLLRDGQPLQSEIYKLDPEMLAKFANKSTWVKPDAVSLTDDKLPWNLMKQPDSFQASDNNRERFTEMRYNVAKPHSY